MTRIRAFAVLAVILLLATAPSCRGPQLTGAKDRPSSSILTEQFVEVLDHGDSAQFRAYARSRGAAVLKEALAEVERSLNLSTPELYLRTLAPAKPRLERIAGALDSEFASPQYLRDIRLKTSGPPEHGRAIYLALERLRLIDAEMATATAANIPRYHEAARRFEALDYPRGMMLVEMGLSGLYAALGRPELRLAHARVTVERSRALGEDFLTCQYLGYLGDCYEELGRRDSMLVAYEEGLALALQRRYPDQASRLMGFIARAYAREGRLALATRWVQQSLRTCRELGGSAYELRYIVIAMRHFAELGCWDVVESLLARCPESEKQLEETTADPGWLSTKRGIACYEARLRLARGDFQGARAKFRTVLEAPHLKGRPGYELVGELRDWSRALVEAGQFAEALPHIKAGLRDCDRWNIFRLGPEFAIYHARVLFELGRTREAAAALRDFDRRVTAVATVPTEWSVERELLRARLFALEGKPDSTQRAIRRSLDALEQHAHRLDAGPLGYLALESFKGVRLAMHELGGLDATAGYRFELDWRALVRELGTDVRQARAPSPNRWLTAAAPESSFALPAGTHLVFLVTPTVIVRWTATSGAVECDTLAISSAECAREVDLATRSLAPADPAAPHADGDREALRRLARALLPKRILAAPNLKNPELLQISADGPLERLAFEALDRSERGAPRPLALDFDVARVRSPAPVSSGPARGRPVILSNTKSTAAVQRMFPGARPLEASGREVAAAKRAWPGAEVLVGDTVHKSTVLERWSRSPRVYVAAHMIRDPMLPFTPFIPLGNEPADSLGSDRIEIADVRSLDLSGCELVVVATCFSGQPYTPGGRVGPSFGDAFVDAGAKCVIQTSWGVDDESAARLMERFLAEWRRNGQDPVRALGSVHRAALNGELGESAASDWAAWSVNVAVSRRNRAPAAGPILSSRQR